MTHSFDTDQLNSINAIKDLAKQAWRNAASISLITFSSLEVDSVIIAGGCFASWLQNGTPKDIDIFILDNPKAYTLANEALKNIKPDPLYDKSAAKINDKIVSVMNDTVDGINYQWIFTKYKTRQELINHFDFVHTKVSYDVAINKLYLSPLTYDAIMKKELIKNGDNVVATWRFEKFTKKGWKIPDRIAA